MILSEDYKNIIRKRQNSYPVETVPIAKDLGLSVYKVDGWSDDISGMIKKESGVSPEEYSIYINKNHPTTRRRFTIAHEIAHFLLHKDLIGDGIVDDGLYRSGLPSVIETEANNLAADILMPWHLIDDAMNDGYSTVPQLAGALNVSKSAMSIRLGVPYETFNNMQCQPPQKRTASSKS